MTDRKYDYSLSFAENAWLDAQDRTAMPTDEVKRRQVVNAAFIHNWNVTHSLKQPTYLMIQPIHPDEPEQAQLIRRWYNRQH